MSKAQIESQGDTAISILDAPGAGGAYHEYKIVDANTEQKLFGRISFQNGPIKENGVNGCKQEDLLAIVLHRLQSFQAGEFPCRENALAITKIEEAMHWLNARTADRQKRQVEGASIK